jgi:signal peptidase I
MFKRRKTVCERLLAIKQHNQITSRQRFWREVKGYTESIIIALIVTTFLFTTVGVAGSSMAPTFEGGSGKSRLESLLIGDRLFIPKYQTWLKRLGIGEYKRGDIIIFRELPSKPCRPGDPGRPAMLVKRLIALPGDHVQVVRDGSVRINGVDLDQNFITTLEHGSLSTSQTVDLVVPEGEFFALGDNRPGSCDSRNYGTIPFTSVADKASAVIWPPVRDGHLNWRAIRPPEAFQEIPAP